MQVFLGTGVKPESVGFLGQIKYDPYMCAASYEGHDKTMYAMMLCIKIIK